MGDVIHFPLRGIALLAVTAFVLGSCQYGSSVGVHGRVTVPPPPSIAGETVGSVSGTQNAPSGSRTENLRQAPPSEQPLQMRGSAQPAREDPRSSRLRETNSPTGQPAGTGGQGAVRGSANPTRP
jgi:hypothetical protein